MNKYRSINFMAWVTVCTIMAVVAGITAFKPLPKNIDSLAVSPGALARLGGAP